MHTVRNGSKSGNSWHTLDTMIAQLIPPKYPKIFPVTPRFLDHNLIILRDSTNYDLFLTDSRMNIPFLRPLSALIDFSSDGNRFCLNSSNASSIFLGIVSLFNYAKFISIWSPLNIILIIGLVVLSILLICSTPGVAARIS